jgi:type IV secretory pathway protease TraF
MLNDLVIAIPPEPFATFLADAGYVPRRVPLIKRVRALSGQTVCREGYAITVDGMGMGEAREYDRGRGAHCPTGKAARRSRRAKSFS